MAVTHVPSAQVFTLTAAADQVAIPIKVIRAIWRGASAAGHTLVIVESSIGDITKQILNSVATGVNFIDSELIGIERTQGWFRQGFRIDTISSGVLDVYYE